MKIHILAVAFLAALTAMPVVGQAQTKPAAAAPPAVVHTPEQAHFLAEATAAREEYEALRAIRNGPAARALSKTLPSIETAYFKKYVANISELYALSAREANRCVVSYKDALTRKDSPLAPIPGLPPLVDLVRKYDFNFFIWQYATEEEVLKITPREYVRRRRNAEPLGDWNSADLNAFTKAAQRLNTPEIWDYYRSKQTGRGLLDPAFVSWINDKSKELETPAAIALIEREVKVLSLSPKSPRRDDVLTQYLTALSLLKQLTPQPAAK